MKNLRSFGFVALSIGLVSCSASRQEPPQAMSSAELLRVEAVTGSSMETQAQRFLDAKDYVNLKGTLDTWTSADRAQRSLDWSKAKMMEGNTILVAYIYAGNLWRLGNSSPPSSPYAELKSTAAMVTLYAFAVIMVDGQKCKDASAPGHNIEVNLRNWGKTTWAYLASLPASEREKIISIALELERKTAPVRGNDRFVCGGGMSEWAQADLSRGKEVPTPPGGVGRTVLVPNNPDYVPELKLPPEYEQQQANVRARLHDMIAAILAKFPNTAP